MANEIVQLTQNVGTQEEPRREKWYPVVLAEAVKMGTEDDDINIIQYITQQLEMLDIDSETILGMLQEIKNFIDNHKDIDLSNYVQKEPGKGLSSNDFTDEEKEKLRKLGLDKFTWTNTNTILEQVGGIAPGTEFNDTNITDVLDMLLCPYTNPTSEHLYYGTNCIDGMVGEKGADIDLSLLPLTTTLIKKTADIKSAHLINVDIELCRITDNVANGGPISFSMDPDERLIIIEDTSLDIVVHDINDNHSIIENKISFVYPMYFGTIFDTDITTEDVFAPLTKVIAKKSSQDFVVTCANQKIVFAYPTVYGSLTSIKDQHEFELLPLFEKSLVSITCADDTTQAYTIYKSYYTTTVTDHKMRFIF